MSNIFFDSHNHFHLNSDFSETSLASNISKMQIMATDLDDYANLVKFCQHNPTRYQLSIGLHPRFSHPTDALDLMQQQLEHNKNISAVGEIGLDLSTLALKQSYTNQLENFIGCIKLAQKYDKPMSIHSVKTHSKVIEILKKYPTDRCLGVIHGFSGSKELAQEFIKLGFKLGVGAVICSPTAHKTRATISQIGLENLVLETDCPFMPIYNLAQTQGKLTNIKLVFKALCEIKKVGQLEKSALAEQLFVQTAQIFQSNY